MQSIAEEAIFPESLTQSYPLASLEVVNTEALIALGANPEQLKQVVSTIIEKVKLQLEKYEANVLYVRDNVLFFTVASPDARIENLLDKSLRLLIALVNKPIEIKGVTLNLKAGLDLCPVSGDEDITQLASVAERHSANAKELVVSAKVYQYCQNQLPFEVIGPMDVMGQSLSFYKLLYQQIQPKKQHAQPQAVTTEVQPAQAGTLADPQVTAVNIPPEIQATHDEQAMTDDAKKQAISNLAAASSAQVSSRHEAHFASANQFLFDFEPSDEPELIDTGLPEKEAFPVINLPTLFGPEIIDKQEVLPYAQAPVYLTNHLTDWLKAKEKKGQSLLINLEPTCGKTTVLNLVRQQLPQDKVIWISGQFYSSTLQTQVPYSLWIEILFNIIGLPLEGLSKETYDAQLGQTIQALFGEFLTPEEMELLYQLIAVPASTQRPRLDTDALTALFHAIFSHFTYSNPIVLLLEDLEYADWASLDLLSQLVQRGLLNYPILLILTSSGEQSPLEELKINLQKYHHVALKIETPAEKDLKAILEAPLGVPLAKLPQHLVKQITSLGQSPMYVEEAMRYLVSQGALELRKKDNRFIPSKNKIVTVSIPYSLQEMIIERARKLDDTTRQVLHFATVLGQRFSIQLLSALVQNPEMMEDSLKVLWEEGFIVPESQIQSQFRHRVLWETLYNTIPKDQRDAYHSQIFSLLQQTLQAQQLTPHPVLIYYHAFYSEKLLFMQSATEQFIIPFLQITGNMLMANKLLCNLLNGIRSSEKSDITPMCLSIAEFNTDIDREIVVSVLSQVIHQPVTKLEAFQLVAVILMLAENYRLIAKPLEAYQLLTHLLLGQEKLLNDSQRKEAITQLLLLLPELGQYRLATWLVDKYLVDTRHLGLSDKIVSLTPYAQVAIVEALIYRTHPEIQSLIELMNQSVQNAEDPVLQVRAKILNLSYALSKGDYFDHDKVFGELLDDIERLGAPDELMGLWGINRLRQQIMNNQLEDGITMYETVSNTLANTPLVLQEGLARNLLTQLLVQNGLFDEALVNIEDTRKFSASFGLKVVEAGCLALKAAILIRMEKIDEANIAVEAAMALVKDKNVGSRLDTFSLIALEAEILILKQQPEAARDLLEPIWSQLSPLRLLPSMLLIAQLMVLVYERLAEKAEYDKKLPFEKLKQQFEQKVLNLQHELNYNPTAA